MVSINIDVADENGKHVKLGYDYLGKIDSTGAARVTENTSSLHGQKDWYFLGAKRPI